MILLALQGFCSRHFCVRQKFIYPKLTFELCKLTMAKSQSMYFSSLDMREAYLSILVDGPPPSAL